jgi:hypothetical protein
MCYSDYSQIHNVLNILNLKKIISAAMHCTYRSVAGPSIWNNKQNLFDFTYVIVIIVWFNVVVKYLLIA